LERPVPVTGGAFFIGLHLVDALVARGSPVHVVGDLSSGRVENIQDHLATGRVELIKAQSWRRPRRCSATPAAALASRSIGDANGTVQPGRR
jgi:nucleoside-diphosphate-sugar epimerase